MKIDDLGLIEMEQSPFPGSVGDTAAECGRYVTLCSLLGTTSTAIPNVNPASLSHLVTPQGVVRYPSPPSPWPASDTSSDQVAPLLASCALTQPLLTNTIISQIKANGYKTGNNNFIELGLLSNMKRAEKAWFQWLWDLPILGQAMLLKLPIAWNPNATKNPLTWIISSKNQTSGYLNFVNALAFARQTRWTITCWLATEIISEDKVWKNIRSYYQTEPNVSWLMNTYAQALPKIWKK